MFNNLADFRTFNNQNNRAVNTRSISSQNPAERAAIVLYPGHYSPLLHIHGGRASPVRNRAPIRPRGARHRPPGLKPPPRSVNSCIAGFRPAL